MLLKDIMREGVVTCGDDITVRAAAKKMANNKVGCLVVANKESLLGILTKSNIIRCLADRKDVDYCKVGEAMNTNVKSGTPGMSIQDAARLMSDNRIKRLPVIENDELVGLVSISEIAPSLGKEMEEISDFFWK